MNFKITNFRGRGDFKLLKFFNVRYSQLLIRKFIVNYHCNNIFQC
jgi:hypothetical protein